MEMATDAELFLRVQAKYLAPLLFQASLHIGEGIIAIFDAKIDLGS